MIADSPRVKPARSQGKSQGRSQSSKQFIEKQASNKGKKQKTVAPVAGQSSLDFFVKRLEKKNALEQGNEPRKAAELQ